MTNYFGGAQFYLPRNDKPALELRNIRIYQQHWGGNTEQLARQYGLTSIQIYHIVREQTAAERARRQLSIFY